MRVVVRREQLLSTICGIGLVLSMTAATPTEARGHRHHHRAHRQPHSVVSTYAPPFAAMMVDGNTGRTLYARNENELRHPASITKVMTLYMLFEQIEKGRMSLDSEIEMSAHAASMAPSKLGLRAGGKLTVETAIKAVVTKSANDVAVAIGEAIGGSEDHFAEMMTAKAHALGMSRTTYVNASGLPDDDQVTTAHDLVLLGRAIQDRFPTYYKYFSTPSFTYAGQRIGNHNHLLGRIEGMDGIKTGYTRASGFNLLTSVKRDGHRLIGVVLGGKSAGVRDHIMADLIEDNIDRTGTSRTAPVVAESNEPEKEAPRPVVAARPEPARVELAKADTRLDGSDTPTVKPLPLVSANADRPRPAFVAATARDADEDRTATTPTAVKRVIDGSTSSRLVTASLGGATPAPMRWVTGPAAARVAKADAAAAKSETKVAKADPKADAKAAEKPAAARTGVQIQVGATDDADKAHDLLAKAKDASKRALAAATPYTEKVTKGGETLWRARFAGLDADRAEAVCRDLKRSGIACFTTKN